MQDQIAGLVAAAVGLIVLIIVASPNFRGQPASVQATQFMTAKQSALDFSTLMEQDFRNMGSNYPAYPRAPDSVITAYDTLSTPATFEFLGQTGRGLPPVTIRYEWEVEGTVSLRDTTVNYYQVRRFVDGQLAGMSTGAVTRFSVRLRTGDGGAVMMASETRQIEVSMRVVSSLGSGRIVEWVRLNEVIHPQALSRYDSV